MIQYQSDLLAIQHIESQKLLIPCWTGKEMTAETFMGEMMQYMQLTENTGARKVIWDHTDFHFQIPPALHHWIDDHVNAPANRRGMHKLAFILGPDLMAQLSTMDVFEEGKFSFYPHYFASEQKAMDWITQKEPVSSVPFEKEIDLLIDHKLGDESATIRLQVDIEHLPFYLKRLRHLLSPKSFSHDRLRRYMSLTMREKEILSRITQGQNNKQMAEELYLSLHTVNTHRRNILKKLDCRNTAELVGYTVFFSF